MTNDLEKKDWIRCFTCGCSTIIENDDKHMSGATAWGTSGNYGSIVYDNWGEDFSRLEIHICDACLLLHKNRVYEYPDSKHRGEPRPWEPDFYSKGDEECVRIFKIDGKFHASWCGDGYKAGMGLEDSLQKALETVQHSAKITAERDAKGYEKACEEIDKLRQQIDELEDEIFSLKEKNE